jgi:hypothetical protein
MMQQKRIQESLVKARKAGENIEAPWNEIEGGKKNMKALTTGKENLERYGFVLPRNITDFIVSGPNQIYLKK